MGKKPAENYFKKEEEIDDTQENGEKEGSGSGLKLQNFEKIDSDGN